MYIDTHSHIYSSKFTEDIDEVLGRSEQQNVGKIYMPNIDSESIAPMLNIESKNPDKYIPMMGLHPCSVKEDFLDEMKLVSDWLAKRKFAAVGEMGIDLYWDKTFFEEQKEAFRMQCELAKKYELPIVMHARDSLEEIIELFEEMVDDKLTGILHCFTGTLEQAQRIIELGYMIGIGGVATFKNGGLDKVLPTIGLDKLVLETDSPYLAPVPHRGKRNESSYIPLIAQRVAELTGSMLEEVEEVTTKNALGLFAK